MVRVYLSLVVALLAISQSKTQRLTCANSNYELVAGRCLRLQPKKTKSYDAAQQACLADGAQLVTPNSQIEQESLRSWSQIPHKKHTEVWVGLQTQWQWQWAWANNSTLNSTQTTWIKWAKGRHTKETNKPSCVILGTDKGVWTDSECNSRRKVSAVCQMDADIVPTIAPTCPEGWWTETGCGGKCFKYFSESTSYSAAQANCEMLNGTLARPENYDTNYYVYKHVPCNAWNWIGLDRTGSSQFVFSGSDGSVPSWTPWQGGEEPIVFDCVALAGCHVYVDYGGQTDVNAWNALPCTEEYPYMCQQGPWY